MAPRGDPLVDRDDGGDHDDDRDRDRGRGRDRGHDDGGGDHVLLPNDIHPYKRCCIAYSLQHYFRGQKHPYLRHGDGGFPAAIRLLPQSPKPPSGICTWNNSYCWNH